MLQRARYVSITVRPFLRWGTRLTGSVLQYQIPGIADEVYERVRVLMPEMPRRLELVLAQSLCGWDVTGRLQRDVLKSVLRDIKSSDPEARDKGQAATGKTAHAQPATSPTGIKVETQQPFRPIKREATLESDTIAVQKRQRTLPDQTAQSESTDAVPQTYCNCAAPDHDLTLVQCDSCDRWWHPGCIGQGQYSPATYQKHKLWARGRDVLVYAEREFRCGECRPVGMKMEV